LIGGPLGQTAQTSLLGQYWNYIATFQFIGSTGPLWFALALLIFSVLYALIRKAFPNNNTTQNNKPVIVTHTKIIAVILSISIGAFLLRLVQPIGTSFYNMQLCYFSEYIVLFILGILAYRHNLLLNIPYRFGITWFKIALWVGVLFWFVMMVTGGALKGMTQFNGGFYWQSAAYAFWEAFFCAGVCLGLLVLYREKYNKQGRIGKFLSENAFAVYVFHAPILIAITLMARGIVIYPLFKMILMVIIVVPVCFGFSGLIRKAPWFKRVFS
jgi:surface polysaccharide O-acyltransferase-like enzyme